MDVLAIAARLVQFAAAAMLFGAPFFCLYSLPTPEGRLLGRRALPAWLFAACCAGLLAAGLVSLALEAATMSGHPEDAWRPEALWDALTGSQFGHGMAARLTLSILALSICAMPPSRGRWAGLALLGAGVLVSFAWTGHGASDDGGAGVLHQGADIVHLLAAGTWLGALVALAALLAAHHAEADVAVLYRALKGFSGVGAAVVAILILTGGVNGWFLVGPAHLSALLTTPYGRLLLAKLGLFGVMLALAARNRLRLTPRLAQSDARTALGALRRNVAMEALAGLGVLALVAALGILPPASMG